jgi:hypothetical protein
MALSDGSFAARRSGNQIRWLVDGMVASQIANRIHQHFCMLHTFGVLFISSKKHHCPPAPALGFDLLELAVAKSA